MYFLHRPFKNFGILLCNVELPHSQANSPMLYLLIKVLLIHIN